LRSARAIGVFDSGVGGLSVLRHIRALLPYDDLIYVADSAHIPYGDKSQDYIVDRSLYISRFLQRQGASAIVIACNTASAASSSILREQFSLPVIAMEPALKPALETSRQGRVGLLATTGTLASERFSALLARYANIGAVFTQGCPGLVEQVEKGELRGKQTRELLVRYIEPLLENGIDTLILGCTHYPFLIDLISDVIGPHIALVDSGPAVARQLQKRILNTNFPLTTTPPSTVFYSSGDTDLASSIISLLWDKPVLVKALPTL
jgi:glutamate racemase